MIPEFFRPRLHPDRAELAKIESHKKAVAMLFSHSGKGSLSLLGEPPATRQQIRLEPRLFVLRPRRWRNLAENIAVFFSGRAPRKFAGIPYFRDCWVAGSLPDGAILASVLWHIVFVLLLVQVWPLLPSPPRTRLIETPQEELIYYGPIDDLPELLPAPVVNRKPAVAAPAKTAESRGADSYHPRQTILNTPLQPNHPRQTLIQPLAPPDPPKVLPPLPNIVTWNEPAKPNLRIDSAALARLKPNAPSVRQLETAAPDVTNQEKVTGAINIAALADEPKLNAPITPMSAPKPAAKQAANDAAPEIIGASDRGATQLIALSATPAPAMPPAVPAGNLSSNLSISPEGKTVGTPGISTTASGAGNGSGASAAGIGNGPAGLSITGGSGPRSAYSAPGAGSAPAAPRAPIMPGTVAAAAPPAAGPAPLGVGARSPSLVAATKPAVKPEALLGSRHTYTLNINMPNLTSAMGSWILTFAEMGIADLSPSARPNPETLSGPEALRKVDPKYPPELRGRRVEGEVILHALIRRDGSVDSIELLAGVDPVLDENAIQALAQWKFRPAERQGLPVEVEAIVRIPFHSAAPLY